MTIEEFEGFHVYKDEDEHSFIYANFDNKDVLIDGLIEYLFTEDNLLAYASSSAKMDFDEINEECWVRLFSNISMFLNDEWETFFIEHADEDIMPLIEAEYDGEVVDGKIRIQKDKIGKIGEYALHVLLMNYFKLDCIIPKINLSTNRNMSVYGIDSLFLDKENRRIYFGESKVSKNIENGIGLINKSLSNYEHQIKEEYRLILLKKDGIALSNDFDELFGHERSRCFSFKKFVEKAKIESIGVPIFIAHGKKTDADTPESYLDLMKKKITKKKLLGLDVHYICISLPIINKDDFARAVMAKVVEKQHEYEGKCS